MFFWRKVSRDSLQSSRGLRCSLPPVHFQNQDGEGDFERVLEALDAAIQSHERLLTQIRQRELEAIFMCTSYGLVAWVVYLAVWWLGILDATMGQTVHKAALVSPVVATPVWYAPLALSSVIPLFLAPLCSALFCVVVPCIGGIPEDNNGMVSADLIVTVTRCLNCSAWYQRWHSRLYGSSSATRLID